jgi:hypothetical protein
MHRNQPQIILDYRRVISIVHLVVRILALHLRLVDLVGTPFRKAPRPTGGTRLSLFGPHLQSIPFPLNMKSTMDTLTRETMALRDHMIHLRVAGDPHHPLHLRIKPQICMPPAISARRFPQRCRLHHLRTRVTRPLEWMHSVKRCSQLTSDRSVMDPADLQRDILPGLQS